MIGFARAQASYENYVPGDNDRECECPDLILCPECGESGETVGTQCQWCKDNNDEEFYFVVVERDADAEDDGVDPRCAVHGYCTGCTSRNCEDCGGGY